MINRHNISALKSATRNSAPNWYNYVLLQNLLDERAASKQVHTFTIPESIYC